MRYSLNGPLEEHLEHCQTPVKRGYQARKRERQAYKICDHVKHKTSTHAKDAST